MSPASPPGRPEGEHRMRSAKAVQRARGPPQGEHRSAQREGGPVTDASAPAPGKAAAHNALQQHLRRQVRGVVALILVLSAVLAALSLVPDVRHERIERSPAPATSAASGDPVPSGPPPVPPASGKDEAGTPAATPSTGSPTEAPATTAVPLPPFRPLRRAPTETAAKAAAGGAVTSLAAASAPVAAPASAPTPAGPASAAGTAPATGTDPKADACRPGRGTT